MLVYSSESDIPLPKPIPKPIPDYWSLFAALGMLIGLFGYSTRAIATDIVQESEQGTGQGTGIDADELPSVDVANDAVPEDDFDAFEDEFETADAPLVFDPLSGYNRRMTRFNDKFYDWILSPMASGYQAVVPQTGRTAIGRFFKNLFFPLRFVNNVLQLKYDAAAEELARFVINTTVGLVGFFDPAHAWLHLEAHPEDFGQTLGFYGVGSGFHLVLPFLGPSNLRDTIGLVPDAYAVPFAYLHEAEAALAIESYRRLNVTSLHLGEYESIRKDALDLYSFLRDAYEQNRNKQIKE
ncbi:MAG: VacJ family lipoprotein [Nitrospiria bacterium]